MYSLTSSAEFAAAAAIAAAGGATGTPGMADAAGATEPPGMGPFAGGATETPSMEPFEVTCVEETPGTGVAAPAPAPAAAAALNPCAETQSWAASAALLKACAAGDTGGLAESLEGGRRRASSLALSGGQRLRFSGGGATGMWGEAWRTQLPTS